MSTTTGKVFDPKVLQSEKANGKGYQYPWQNSRYFRLSPEKFAIFLDPKRGYSLPERCPDLSPPPEPYEKPQLRIHVGWLTNAISTNSTDLAQEGDDDNDEEDVSKPGNAVYMKVSSKTYDMKLVDGEVGGRVEEDHVHFLSSFRDSWSRCGAYEPLIKEFCRKQVQESVRAYRDLFQWRKKRRMQEYRVGRRIFRTGNLHLFNPAFQITTRDITAWRCWVQCENACDNQDWISWPENENSKLRAESAEIWANSPQHGIGSDAPSSRVAAWLIWLSRQ